MSLVTVPRDIISAVLSLCSVHDVVRLGMTCKHLRTICESRSTWMSKLLGLGIDSAPDLPPHVSIDNFSDQQLKGKVVDATLNSIAWKKRYSLELHLKDELHLNPDPGDYSIMARAIPGGGEVLVVNHRQLELWSIESKLCLWSAKKSAAANELECTSFDFDIQTSASGGTHIMIAAEYSSILAGSTTIRVFRYDMSLKQGEIVAEKIIPPALDLELTIRGDVVLVRLVRIYKMALINWRENTAVQIDLVDPEVHNFNRRICALTLSENGQHLIGVIMNKRKLSAVTFPIHSLSIQSSSNSFTDWPKIPFDTHSFPNLPLTHPNLPSDLGREGLRFLNMHLFTPTWFPNAPTELFLVTYSQVMAEDGEEQKYLISFRVHLRPSEDTISLNIKLVDAAHGPIARIPRDPFCITNTGRMYCVRECLRCFKLLDASGSVQLVKKFKIENHPWIDGNTMDTTLALGPIYTSTEPWSGTIVALMQGVVRLYRIG